MAKIYILTRRFGQMQVIASDKFWTSTHDAHWDEIRNIIDEQCSHLPNHRIEPKTNDDIRANRLFAYHDGGYSTYYFKELNNGSKHLPPSE